MWRRSRRALAEALPVGAVIGAVIGLVFVLGGNPDYRDQGGWGAFAYMTGAGALVGIVNALAAVAGAALGVLLLRSSNRREELFRRAAVIGAACGAAMVWLGLGILDGVSRGSWMWMHPLGLAAVVAAIIAAIAAETLLIRAERREHEGALERSQSDG